MTPERWEYTSDYLQDVFGGEDEHLAGLMPRAVAAGLPDIAVDAVVGRLLLLMTTMSRGKLAVELGTLAGYSAIWIARGLKPGGKLITIEIDAAHADFAEAEFERAGVADRIELRRGDARDVLESLGSELSPGSIDLAFLDADKERYPAYWNMLRPMIAVGGLIVMDNALGGGSWWIDDESSRARHAADTVNRLVADDDDFEAVAFPLRQGVMVGLRTR